MAESASFSYSEFTPVKSRKNRKSKNARASPPLSAVLAALRDQLRQEEWFAQCSQIMKTCWDDFSAQPPAVLCLGLGSPSTSPIARIQLAFLAETCNLLKVAPDAVAVFDPVFTGADTALFAALHMRVLAPGPAATAAHVLHTPTLCFMPHCDMELYDALLRANWSPAGLANLFIVGNSLQEYLDNKPLGALQTRVPCLLRAAPRLQRRPLPPSRAWPTAFNNTSVQFRLHSPLTASGDDDDKVLFAAPLPWADPNPDIHDQLPAPAVGPSDTDTEAEKCAGNEGPEAPTQPVQGSSQKTRRGEIGESG